MPGKTDYLSVSADAPNAATTTIQAELPTDGVLQSADASIVTATAGPLLALLAYGDSISLSFTALKSGVIRNALGTGLSQERLAWQGRMNLGAKQAAHPQLRLLVRNDTGAAVTGVFLTYEVSHD